MLADWAVSTGHNQVSFGEWKSMLLHPCMTSILATIVILSMSSCPKIIVARERNCLLSIDWVILLTWLLKSSTVEVIFWWSLTWDTYLQLLHLFRKDYLIYFILKCLCHQFSNFVPSKSIIIQQTIDYSSLISILLHIRSFSLQNKMYNQMHCPKFYLQQRFSFITVQGMSQKGITMLQLSTFS